MILTQLPAGCIVKLASTSSESSPASSSDEINLIYSCWVTFMGLYIANYVAERSLEPGEKYKKNKQTKPDFLDMVPWYSGTSADLYKTVFDLVVSVTVFLGRFDMRILQAAMNQIQVVPKNKKEAQAGIQQGDYLYDHFSKEKELWFDFMADTGDGGNSTYTVARLLAQPHIKTNSGILKRGDLLLIGGDLAYPNPSEFTYERRLFRPFKYALQPPPCHEQGHMGVKKLDEMPPCYEQQRMAVDKSAIPPGMTGLKKDKKRIKKRKQSLPYDGPRCFVIPGNHDWFDGLHTFTRNICHRSWLGGWFMPQKKSYFALQLPMGWWIFGLDLALHGDIDVYQFEFFSKLARNMLALRNIWNFRKENWQFDFIGGIIYFTLVFSMFPQCELDHIFQEDSISGFSRSFFGTVWNAFIFMMDLSYVSLGGATLLLILAIAFVPSKVSSKTRVMIGVLHVSAHLTAALILMLVLELGIETFVRHKLVATSGYHSLYRWHQSMFHRHLPVPIAIQDSIKRWTFGLYPACIKYLMSAFDLPELMAVTRSNICKNGMESISRWGAIIYYASVFLYFWVLSTPAVSLVFGSYLYVCVNWLNLHYDEAFSSLRIADYKAFTRFHIKHNGDLEVFTLAVDKVPEDWELDPEWEGPNSNELSHHRKNPSQWKAADSDQEPLNTVRIIDKFVIPQKPIPESLDDISGSETE
ncbi:uncharacterized protein LOC142637993 [Castanea sativa]|uniref:uncharacterized protein LOC142637993 n=1 Tax=Castanea sativa TaxID=21020 RepID=UPI003F6501C0